MSQHPRSNQSKKKATLPKRRVTRPSGNRVQKKNKRICSPPSSNARPKRLSGLTANTLLQYCTNLLSPNSHERTRTAGSNTKKTTKGKVKSTKEENEPPPSPPAVARTRREASSRASALILQQNEIERSRFNFPLSHESNARRLRTTKSSVVPVSEPFQFNIPAPPVVPVVPSMTNISNQAEYAPSSKYPPLTEASLAEHDRLLGTIPSYHLSKRENLLKWTQELEAFDHSSPPSPNWNDKEPAGLFRASFDLDFNLSF